MITEVAAIQAEADRQGIPLLQVTKRAGVDYKTWWRWKKRGDTPTPIYLRAMQDALRELIAAKRAA